MEDYNRGLLFIADVSDDLLNCDMVSFKSVLLYLSAAQSRTHTSEESCISPFLPFAINRPPNSRYVTALDTHDEF